MYGASTLVNNSQSCPNTSFVQGDVSRLGGFDSTRHSQRVKVCLIDWGEQVIVRIGEEATVQCHLQITIVGVNGIMNGNQVRSGCKGSFNLHLFECTCN